MPSNFTVQGDQTAGSSQTVMVVTGSATVMPSVFYVQIGSPSTPADAAIQLQVRHTTAAGTGTSVTPQPLWADDRVAVCTCADNQTSVATFSGVALLNICMNQRSVYQWYAAPGAEFVGKKAASAGVGIDCVAISTGTPEIEATMHFSE